MLRRSSALLTAFVVLAVPLAGWAALRHFRTRGENSIVLGQRLAAEQGCFACHGGASSLETLNPGSRFDSIPRLQSGDARMYANEPNEITEWIRDGAPQSLRSDSAAWEVYQRQTLRMPAFGDRLEERDIALLTDYVLAANAWETPEDPVAARGEEVARGHCLNCHNVGGAGGLPNPGSVTGRIPGWWGKDFEDLVRSEDELLEWIADGRSRRVAALPFAEWFWKRQRIAMPAYRDRLSDEDRRAVAAFIRWLGQSHGGTHPAAAPAASSN